MNEQDNLAISDTEELTRLAKNPPQSLIIEAESGLDINAAVRLIFNKNLDLTIRPTPEDKRRSLGVDQIREIRSSLKTQSANRRIFVFSEEYEITHAAQSALLKTLEEPISGVHFVIVTNDAKNLIDTVRSRCQIVKLTRTSSAQDKKIIAKYDISDTRRQQILFLASGRPILIEKMASDDKEFDYYSKIASDAKSIISSPKSYESLKIILGYNSDRVKASVLISIMIDMIKFRIKSSGLSPELEEATRKIIDSEEQLKLNGNTRLALLNIVV